MPMVVVGGAVAGAYGFQRVRANYLLRPPDGYDGLAQYDQELQEDRKLEGPTKGRLPSPEEDQTRPTSSWSRATLPASP